MPEYTHLNLKDDVPNAAEQWGFQGMEARFARKAAGVQGGGFSYQRFEPNLQVPTAHRHEHQEEVYVVIGGGGRIKIEDEVQPLRQWDVVRLAPSTARAFEAGPDGLELIAIGFGEGGDAQLIEDFWVD